MKKKLFILALNMMVEWMLVGCQMEADAPTKEASVNQIITQNSVISVYNWENAEIGQIEYSGIYYLVDGSIVYSIDKGDRIMEYYRYDLEKQEMHFLGEIKDYASALKESVLINDYFYFIIYTGDIYDSENRMLKLMQIDLKNNILSEIYVKPEGSTYAHLLGVEEQLFITYDHQEGSCLAKVDIQQGREVPLLETEYNSDAMVGRSIYQVDYDGEEISVLMLEMDTENNVQLMVEAYDSDMNYLYSKCVSEISDRNDERRQPVVNFEFSQNWMLYENRSTTQFLGNVEQEEMVNYLEIEGNMDSSGAGFGMAYENVDNHTTKLGAQYFTNSLFLFNLKDGSLMKTEFCAPDEERYQILSLQRGKNGDLLIKMAYRDSSSSERLERLYFVNEAALNFQ